MSLVDPMVPEELIPKCIPTSPISNHVLPMLKGNASSYRIIYIAGKSSFNKAIRSQNWPSRGDAKSTIEAIYNRPDDSPSFVEQ